MGTTNVILASSERPTRFFPEVKYTLEQVTQIPIQASEAVDATSLFRLLRRILTETDSAFLFEQKLSGDEIQKWRDCRKSIYFETLRDLSETVTAKINEYSLAHFSQGTQWAHVQNTFRFKFMSAVYVTELRIAGHAYFLGIAQAIPAAEKILQNLAAFGQPLQLASQSVSAD